MKKIITGLFLAVLLFIFSADAVLAHPGRTDSSGGHTCRTNCEEWGLEYGEYHYHNGGSAPAPDPVPPPPAPTLKPSIAPTIKPKPSIKPATPKPSPKVTPIPTPTPTPVPSTKPTTSELISKLIASNKNLTLAELILKQIKAKPGKEVAGESTETAKEGFYKVTDVIDGDTIRVNINGKIEKIRLLGIDTPETVDPRKEVQCFGLEASKKLKELISGKNVGLEVDSTQPDRDKYQRLLRWVYLEDGADINLLMVQEGYAFSYKKYPTQKLDKLNLLEQQARAGNKGLWSNCNEYN